MLGIRQQQERIPPEDAQHLRRDPEPQDPQVQEGELLPDDILERCQRTDRALMAAVAEMHGTGTGTRKVQRIAGRMGIGKLSKDQVSSMARSLDADVGELLARPLGGLAMPCLWPGLT